MTITDLEPVIVAATRKVTTSEDALQEARIGVWQESERRGDMDPRLAATVAKRRAIDYVRAEQGEARYPTGRHAVSTVSIDKMQADMDDPDKQVSVATLAALSTEDVHSELTDTLREKLSVLDRELLHLVYWQGFPKGEAAARLGVAPETVSRRLSRIFHRLKKELTYE